MSASGLKATEIQPNPAVHRMNILSHMLFLGQFLRRPGKIGSVCPSSRFLTNALVQMALERNSEQGIIVDLGAGTGVVSQELLNQGVAPSRILAVDLSWRLTEPFRRRHPEVTFCIGDARRLDQIIDRNFPGTPVQAIISSLPLKSMPDDVVAEIMLVLLHILQKYNGVLIQYTYALWMRASLEKFGYVVQARRLSPVNLPPALVEKYGVSRNS